MKLGIIGSGMIVRDVLSFIGEIKEIELVHISGTVRSEAILKELCDKYHFHRYSTDYTELLNDDEVDTIYVALPNYLHYQYSKDALLAHKHVILEKPFTVNDEEAEELIDIAKTNHLFLWEAITNQYLGNYQKIKELIPLLGDIKIVECNFSQYSSRYDAFKQGTILPAFDYTKAGGALMDLNIYNLHFVVGLFGEPTDVHYYPNITNNIDTSGVLILNYPTFKCVCIGAKDCKAPLSNHIQGDQGCLSIKSPLSLIDSVTYIDHQGNEVVFNENKHAHRMYDEFSAFVSMLDSQDFGQCYNRLQHSLMVTKLQTKARKSAKLYLGEEDEE